MHTLFIAFVQMASCGYVLLMMSIYWLTEALPIAVTSIIPLLLFPALGVVPSKQVANNYFSVSYFESTSPFSLSNHFTLIPLTDVLSEAIAILQQFYVSVV